MAVVKRCIGNSEFFYLKRSFRKKGEIVTKEAYLGKKIPSESVLNNIEQELMSEQKAELYKKLGLIKHNFQKEWNHLPESVKKKELQEIAISFTYNTNAIEGSTITLEETRELIEDQIAPNKSVRDIRETEEHAKIFLEILEKAQKIDKKTLLEWHKRIFGQTKPDIAGSYRDYLVRVGSYVAPDWQDVEKLMEELIAFINHKPKNINAVEFAAIVHFRFEHIHPFGDGNGRIGRLLMNYILWHENYPMLIIEYKKRRFYYKALMNEEKFIRYFMRRYLSVHKKLY